MTYIHKRLTSVRNTRAQGRHVEHGNGDGARARKNRENVEKCEKL